MQPFSKASGFPRLDEACLKGVKGQRMKPATEDGKPDRDDRVAAHRVEADQ